MDPYSAVHVNPTEVAAARGQQARFQFMTIDGGTVAYKVQCADEYVGSWCRFVLPAAESGPGELLIDVPADARRGRYSLRVVAMAGSRRIVAADVTLRVEDDRCLRIVSLPKVSLQPDGTVLVSVPVLNCGMVDMNLQLQARHEDGWSFTVDSSELIIGVGKGPVGVKVTLRPPEGERVRRGDRITVEVDTGTGWPSFAVRVPPRLVWPWVAAAAVVAAATAGALVALWPDNDDVVEGPDDGIPNGEPAGDGTSVVEPAGDELVEVPDVVGRTADDADDALRSADFDVATEESTAAQVEPGVVADQDPAAGSQAEPGTTVTIFVATGVVVPDVVALSPTDAEAELIRADLTTQFDAPDPGICSSVADQSPAAGTTVMRGSVVALSLTGCVE
jgi:hypothetical protein